MLGRPCFVTPILLLANLLRDILPILHMYGLVAMVGLEFRCVLGEHSARSSLPSVGRMICVHVRMIHRIHLW